MKKLYFVNLDSTFTMCIHVLMRITASPAPNTCAVGYQIAHKYTSLVFDGLLFYVVKCIHLVTRPPAAQ